MALFPEACANGSALLLNNGSLVGDGLCGANVADELLDCGVGATMSAACQCECALRHLARTKPTGTHCAKVGPARGPGGGF